MDRGHETLIRLKRSLMDTEQGRQIPARSDCGIFMVWSQFLNGRVFSR
jgi:hypothetical protein